MSQPPTRPVISRELVRFIPFASQQTVVNGALAAGGTIVRAFDVADPVTDVNQLLGSATPDATPTMFAVGPWLDVGIFSDQVGRIDIAYAIDSGCSYRNVTAGGIAVPASTFTNVSGLRITARFVRITYTNTSAVNALVEYGSYVRSS